MPSSSLSRQQQPSGGFALVIALSLMAFVLLLLLSITTLVQVESQSASIASARVEAEQAALLGLNIALGELQKTAGPDQRVTAVADLLSNDTSKGPAAGRNRWAGVWDTSTYSPADPDNKNFKGWLVSSSSANGLTLDTDAKGAVIANANKHTIFEAVDASGSPDPSNDVIVEKIPFSSAGSSSESYYAYWVEDQGVKADLSWNEGTFTDDERKQAARLSSAPGVDYGVFGSYASSPFKDKVDYPLEADGDNGWLADIEKATSVVDMPAVMDSSGDHADWLKAFRHDMTFGSRAVLCDVKNGGLRRDLSLAFEMDGITESENATFFNQQAGEFVSGTDTLSAIQAAPGMTVLDRFLFRDFKGAGNVFSDAISDANTVARGPSWWLLRDYANLYKRLKTSGSGYALDARAYFPNRTTRGEIYDNLFDIHAYHQNFAGNSNIKVQPINRETNGTGGYAFQPARASYAPVLLGVNAIYSLVYKDNKLQLVVDPFFIIWNPYDTQITAPRFAVTLENGLAGGVRFKVTDSAGIEKLYGKPSRFGNGAGSDTSFSDYAKHKSGVDANLSYLISNLSMNPGEVQIYSPPNKNDRSNTANVLNDELKPGMNYNVTDSGIFFDEFPDQNNRNWGPVVVPSTEAGQTRIDVLFNIASQAAYAIINNIEINLPASAIQPDQLISEDEYGDHIQGKEFRLNLSGSEVSRNVNTGERGFSLEYTFAELGGTKKSFGILSILTLPTDHLEAETAVEVFSQLNVTAAASTWLEIEHRAPFNMVVKSVAKDGINNLINEVGVDFDAIGLGLNGFYGKSYSSTDGDTAFPLLTISPSPLHSLVQFSSANIGTRLVEPTHAIGNSWKPPYIPKNSIYDNTTDFYGEVKDTSWLVNDALFDRYYLSGIAPAYTIGAGGYAINGGSASAGIETTLQTFYGSNSELAKANPALEPYLPDGMTATQVEGLLTPADGYQKLGAYSLIKGAFNVNSTSVAAWAALLRGNKDLAIQSIQGTTDSATGTPFPLSSSASDTTSTNGWEKLSRLSDPQIDLLAEKIVDEVRARGPFMSLGDFVNRRISTDNSSSQGALQEAIEQAGVNSGIRANTSDTTPNYSDYASIFPYADTGARNNATGIPLEINQANILLPIAPKLTARSDTFKIRAYGEVVSMRGDAVQAVCEATVQRVPEYLNTVDAPWDENYTNPLFPDGAPQLDSINQSFGRRFKIVSIRWLDHAEI